MDKNSNAKPISKKTQMAVDKSKKSASKKKKRSKKLLSAKSDQSPDPIEVEGVRVLDQPGVESDSSSNRQQTTGSPSLSRKSSAVPESETESPAPPSKSSPPENEPKPKPQRKLPDNTNTTDVVYMKATNSSSYLNDSSNKKASVSFSDLQEIQTITSSVANMSVKSKNGSQRNKNKSSKSSSNGASKREKPEKPKSEPLKSCINKAADVAAKKQSKESLRWEFTLENADEEEERIRIYKMNRRKRYLDAAQKKGLGWVADYGKNGSPVADETVNMDSPVEIERETHVTVTDFSPVRSIIASQSSTPITC